MMVERLEFSFFGFPTVTRNHQAIPMPDRKTLALLAYLAMTGERQGRDTLATLFWPAHNQRQARSNLRYVLWLLKKNLGDTWLEVDRESVGLKREAELWIDVELFQELWEPYAKVEETNSADIPTLHKVVALFRGDFLAGFTLADSAVFDEWQSHHSEQLRSELAAALEKLVRYHGDQREFTTAIPYARRWLALDPLHEPVHRHLMRLYARSGQRGMALRQYEECARLLQQELAVMPEEETAALYDLIRTRRYPATEVEKERLAPQPLSTNDSLLPHAASQIGPFKLPIASTSFVGREKELAQIGERFADPVARLVTIVGLGGMGKSRLAVEAAVRMLDQFADGVWFVPLASVTSAGLIPAAIAAALEIPIQGAIELEAHVIHYLSDKRLLLILDNLEQLLDGTLVIERLLDGAPGVKVLATSRVRLRLDQEWLLPLEGLTVPSSIDFSTLTPAEYTAVDLFVQRARRTQPDFTLSGSTSAEVIRICRLVGGMPLAIELAAAWLRIVPLAEIAGEIQANLDFLATSMRNEPQRHRNMRAVFERSWHLLDDRERHTLMHVSLFRGGFARQAAAVVADADLGILSGLVDSSWLQLTLQSRYEIHELARQYAEERLDAEPATATQARAAHCAYYAALADRLGGPTGNMSENSKLNILVLELDNIWAGWHWAAANRNFEEVGRYVNALVSLADAHGLYGEVVGEFEEICALARKILADVSLPVASTRQITLVLARLLYQLCFLYARAISVERGRARGAESIELLRQLELDGRSGEVSLSYLQALGTMSYVTGVHADYPQARLYCDEIMRLTRGKNEHQDSYCDALYQLGQVAHFQGNFAEAESLLTAYLAQAVEEDQTPAKDRLAQVYADLGDLRRAAQFAAAAVIAVKESGRQPDIAAALLAAAEIALAQSYFEEVERYLDRALVIAEETGNRYVRVRFLNGRARLARCLGRPVEAQQLYRQAYELARSMARNKDAALAQVGLGFSLLDQGKIEDAGACFRDALQAAWERRIIPEVIWAVVGLAALKGYEGQPQLAERWLRSAVAHPSCPQRVQVEATEIRKRLALAKIAHALDEELLLDPDTALEGIVLELLL